MEDLAIPAPRRRRLLAKFTGVALIGFAVSALILHLGLEAGLRPWAARLIALLCAMHVTFLINGRFVFRALTRRRFLAQWAAYVTNSAFGNFYNYWVFVTLESTHRLDRRLGDQLHRRALRGVRRGRAGAHGPVDAHVRQPAVSPARPGISRTWIVSPVIALVVNEVPAVGIRVQ